MEQKTKRYVFLIGSIIVAVIFISSYAAFSNNGTPSTTTTIAKQVQTIFITGYSNATITNYSDIAVVSLLNSSPQLRNQLNSTLSDLQNNGSVVESIFTNDSYQGSSFTGISPYSLEQIIYSKINQTNSINVGATADVELPSTITFYYSKQPVKLQLPSRNYSVQITNAKSIGSSINVSISTLLYANNRHGIQQPVQSKLFRQPKYQHSGKNYKYNDNSSQFSNIRSWKCEWNNNKLWQHCICDNPAKFDIKQHSGQLYNGTKGKRHCRNRVHKHNISGYAL